MNASTASSIPWIFCASLLACQANVDPDDRELTDGDRLEDTAPLHGPGPHGLYVIDEIEIPGSADGRTITAAVCAPGESGALSMEGPYPLVIIEPGAKQPHEQYMSYCQHLATWGFFVVAQDIVGNDALFPPANHKPLAADLRAIIDWATSEQNELAGAIDGDAIGVAGHSLGGKVAFLAAAADARIGAVVGWDPVDANAPFTSPGSSSWSSVTPELMPNLHQPIAVIGETLNSKGSFFAPACAPADQSFQQYYEHAGANAFSVEVFEADHMDWTDSGSCSPCSPCGPKEVHPVVQQITRHLTTAWFLRHLAGDESIDPAKEMQPEVDAGRISVQAK